MMIALLLPVFLQAQSTVKVAQAMPPVRISRVLYYDDALLVAARSRDHALGEAFSGAPAIFVHSKAHDRWLQVTAISTVGGRFGSSTSADTAEQRQLMKASVGWNDKALAKQPFVEGAELGPPERIELDVAGGRLVFRYHASWNIASAETVLYVRRRDLLSAFGTAPTPR